MSEYESEWDSLSVEEQYDLLLHEDDTGFNYEPPEPAHQVHCPEHGWQYVAEDDVCFVCWAEWEREEEARMCDLCGYEHEICRCGVQDEPWDNREMLEPSTIAGFIPKEVL